jgi:hypothetical protein
MRRAQLEVRKSKKIRLVINKTNGMNLCITLPIVLAHLLTPPLDKPDEVNLKLSHKSCLLTSWFFSPMDDICRQEVQTNSNSIK